MELEMIKLYSGQAENAAKKQSKGNDSYNMSYSYGSFVLHSVLLQKNTNAKFQVNLAGIDIDIL